MKLYCQGKHSSSVLNESPMKEGHCGWDGQCQTKDHCKGHKNHEPATAQLRFDSIDFLQLTNVVFRWGLRPNE